MCVIAAVRWVVVYSPHYTPINPNVALDKNKCKQNVSNAKRIQNYRVDRLGGELGTW